MSDRISCGEIAFNEKKCKDSKKKNPSNESDRSGIRTPIEQSIIQTPITPSTPNTPTTPTTPTTTDATVIGEQPDNDIQKVTSVEKADDDPDAALQGAKKTKSKEVLDESKTNEEETDVVPEKPKKKKKKKKQQPPPQLKNDEFNVIGKPMDQDEIDLFDAEDKKRTAKKSKRKTSNRGNAVGQIVEEETPSDRKKQENKKKKQNKNNEEFTEPVTKSEMAKNNVKDGKDGKDVVAGASKEKNKGDKKRKPAAELTKKRKAVGDGNWKDDDSERKRKQSEMNNPMNNTLEGSGRKKGVATKPIDKSGRLPKPGRARSMEKIVQVQYPGPTPDANRNLPPPKKTNPSQPVPPPAPQKNSDDKIKNFFGKLLDKAKNYTSRRKSDDSFMKTETDVVAKPDVKAEYDGEECKDRPPRPPYINYENNTNNRRLFPNNRPFWIGHDSSIVLPSVKELVISRKIKAGAYFPVAMSMEPRKEEFNPYREIKIINQKVQDPWAVLAPPNMKPDEYIVSQTMNATFAVSKAKEQYDKKRRPDDDSKRMNVSERARQVKFLAEPTKIRIYERRKFQETITQDFKPGQIAKPEKKKKHKPGQGVVKNESNSSRKSVQ